MAKKVTVMLDVSELQTLVRKIEAAAREAGDFMTQGVVVLAETMMTDVKASRAGAGVPKDKGDLARSGRVVHQGQQKWADLTFGGPAAPYALVQHENTKFRHTLGEARYLIRASERLAANGDSDKALEEIMEQVEKRMKAAA